jgi:TrmH family RNA methyltransferase
VGLDIGRLVDPVATRTVTRRNAAFQQWRALLTNRTKRNRSGAFLVHGVRPITLAVEHRWVVRSLLFPGGRELSAWARELIDRLPGAERVVMSPELIQELGEKAEEVPELVAVVELPADRLERIVPGPEALLVAFDRPTSPGNLGSLIRSADALGASGVIITGHAADPYDPKAVRASTGSLFSVPVVRAGGHRSVLEWVEANRSEGCPLEVVGTDETGTVDLADHDLTGPTLVAIGNETRGLSTGWREACDELLRIPMAGSASSLNVASAGTVVLYEAMRQRSDPSG